MSVETILVFGEGDESGPSGLTLELLAAARELAANVEVFVAGDGAAMAAELGSHGASTVYSTGPLDGKLMGVHAAATRGPSGRMLFLQGRRCVRWAWSAPFRGWR